MSSDYFAIDGKNKESFKAQIKKPATIPKLIKLLESQELPKVVQCQEQCLAANYIYFSADSGFVEEPAFAQDFELLYPTKLGETGSLSVVITDFDTGSVVLELTKYANRSDFCSSSDTIAISYDKFDVLLKILKGVKSLKFHRAH